MMTRLEKRICKAYTALVLATIYLFVLACAVEIMRQADMVPIPIYSAKPAHLRWIVFTLFCEAMGTGLYYTYRLFRNMTH